MATPSEENANETEETNNDQTMEKFHDAATVHNVENLTLTGAEWKEIHLLLEITYKVERTEARTSPQKHMLILKAFENAFDNTELEMNDNKNRKLINIKTQSRSV
jgi:hypothetical protein